MAKSTRAFSLRDDLLERIDALPDGTRSEFVEAAITIALMPLEGDHYALAFNTAEGNTLTVAISWEEAARLVEVLSAALHKHTQPTGG